MKIFRTSHTFKHSRFKKCACTFVALWALFILSRFPSSVWTTSVGVPKPAELASFYKNMVESEWEWARNMSIVYTWVNGSESKYRTERILNGGSEYGGTSRDRDSNELLYSLRSLSTYLPWHSGKIYIVTQGQIPTWLNVSNPRIQIVDHSAIIPKEYLPTYNSNVIESYLYLIPGLTDMFVYFNDDVFVQSTLHPSDLFTSSRDAKLFVDDFTIPLNKTVQRYVIDKVQNSVYWSAMFKTVQILEDTYGADGFRPLQVLEHAPFVFDKGVIQQMHHLWAHEFQAAHINKFRRDNDILFAFAYYGYLTHQGSKCCDRRQENFETRGLCDGIEFSDDTTSNSKAIDKLREQGRRKFLNVNDNMGDSSRAEGASRQLKAFLDEEFGSLKSPFEL